MKSKDPLRIRIKVRKGRRLQASQRPLSHRIAAIGTGLFLMVSGTGYTLVTGATSAAATNAAGPCAPTRPIEVRQATAEQLKAAGYDKLPLAPEEQRVDLVAPPFSDPTKITNPLFPISDLRSTILNGRVDDKPFKTETTLLPETRVLKWAGDQCIEVLVSQYLAYSNGRIKEVALDLYAQADDGSVWYLGENVFNYERGKIIDTSGTWFAGREGPPAMIMPANPQVGDTFRPENIPGFVFEEVTVEEVDQTVQGPYGPVEGAIITKELHQDGSFEEKLFAPGYGEFFTGSGGDIEAMALAVPTDAIQAPVPQELIKLSSAPKGIFAAVGSRNWNAAEAASEKLESEWQAYEATGEAAQRLRHPMTRALRRLSDAITAREPRQARRYSIEIGLAALDIQLQYRAPNEVDVDRFELWARSVMVDAAADNASGVLSDVSILEWIRHRFANSIDKADLTGIDVRLLELREHANARDLEAAAETARELREIAAKL